MLYLIPIPIVLIAVIIKLVSDRYGIKIFSILSNIVIIIGILFFIYLYADYNGYNIFKYVKRFVFDIINFFKTLFKI